MCVFVRPSYLGQQNDVHKILLPLWCPRLRLCLPLLVNEGAALLNHLPGKPIKIMKYYIYNVVIL